MEKREIQWLNEINAEAQRLDAEENCLHGAMETIHQASHICLVITTSDRPDASLGVSKTDAIRIFESRYAEATKALANFDIQDELRKKREGWRQEKKRQADVRAIIRERQIAVKAAAARDAPPMNGNSI